MTDRPVALTEADARILQRMIDREKRQTINAPPVFNHSDRGDDQQAPEMYVAWPPSTGIPGTDAVDDYEYGFPVDYAEYAASEHIVGSAECDIYRILRDGSLDKLTEVRGLSKTVFNLGDTVIAQAMIPITRDKFGSWIALSGNGGGSTFDQIDFEIYAWVPDDPTTTGCDAVYATVTQVSCGSSVSVGDAVIIYDPNLCWFNLPVDILVGLRGTAVWMKSNYSGTPGDSNYCNDAPTVGSCLWVVKGICCAEEIYAV